jgi:hypothetical protein
MSRIESDIKVGLVIAFGWTLGHIATSWFGLIGVVLGTLLVIIIHWGQKL